MPSRFLDKNFVARTPDTYSKVVSCQHARALRAVFMRCVVFGSFTGDYQCRPYPPRLYCAQRQTHAGWWL